MKILIVEDDSDSRLVLRKNLQGAGHEVIESIHGEDALKKGRVSVPDLIISDILMPVMDGYKLCYEVKNDDKLRTVPFIFYTATYTDIEDERLAIGLGASRFVLKPADPEEFMAIIDEVVNEVRNGEVPIPDEPIDEPLNLFRKYDTSLSRKLEDKVRELELYRRVFDNSTEAIAVVNRDGHIVRQNPAHSHLFGYSDDELWGKTPGMYLPKEEMDAIAKKMTEDGGAGGESLVALKDSREIFIEYSVFSIKDELNEISNYVWLLRDITEKKNAEEKLRKAYEEWDNTFDAINDIITLQDLDNRIVRANKATCTMFNLSSDQIIGKYCYEIFAGISEPCHGCPIPTSIETFLPYTTEVVHPKLNRTFKVTAVPVVGDELDVQLVAHFARDITEQKKLEENYRQAQKMEAIGRLSGGVAHDFNNILTSILGYSDIIMMQLPKDSQIRDDIKQIHRSGKRAASLTRQLLAFSRKQVLEMRVIDLNVIIDDLSKMLSRLISENIDLQIVLGAENPLIYADIGQIEQVVMNLTVNARDAMPEGGSLLIKTGIDDVDEGFVRIHDDLQRGPHAVLTVADTGHGISSENRDKVFEPFFTTKEVGKGTGLGLATVYGIVKQHQGSIYVYSVEGEGTTFKVYIPLNEKSAEMSPVLGRNVHMKYKGTETILVVDDDEMVREMLRSALSNLGYTILIAENADRAISLLDEFDGVVHMLLSDVVMPGMSGTHLAKIAQEKVPGIKVMLMSGYAEEIVREKDLIPPEYGFMDKPIIPSLLAFKLHRIFAGE